MYKNEVEIYSDSTNSAVMKHPGRNYPGLLLQGDTLYSLCQLLDEACAALKNKEYDEAQRDINNARNALWAKLSHYKTVLSEHEIAVPFNEIPPKTRV